MNHYIDADLFVKEINERIDAAIKWGCNAIADGNTEIKIRAEQAVATFCEASLTAKKIPSADVREIKRGRWLLFDNPNYSPFDNSSEYVCKCSLCGNEAPVSLFCPYCGAEMRNDKDGSLH